MRVESLRSISHCVELGPEFEKSQDFSRHEFLLYLKKKNLNYPSHSIKSFTKIEIGKYKNIFCTSNLFLGDLKFLKYSQI